MVTCGHAATSFFADWKPDHILTVSDHYLFRPTRRGAKLRDKLAKNAMANSKNTLRLRSKNTI
jgi:hypothetical protein